ncbi:MAG TPA: helix-turn-helix transcriptional regulator [Polyangiaceae bacterium]|jgi:transcriptional regulator with XRE-family HTH domain|nr:helix-turn-helix transcriptional regulator [Polyangiaceae bacterium]
MPHIVGPDVHGLVVRARMALDMTQKQLAEMLGVSLRTANRWEGGGSYPDLQQVGQLARAVHPKDAALAEALAGEAGTTLEALGLVARKSPSPPLPPAPPPRAFPPIDLMVDSVILAAADTVAGYADCPLQERSALLDVLRAAISRARRLGLTLEEVDAVLSRPSAAPPAEPKPATAKKTASR